MEDSFRTILDEQIDIFNRTMLICNSSFKDSFEEKSWLVDYENAGFICFGVTDHNYYYQYVNQIQHDLDCCIRCILLSGVLLRTLFDEYVGYYSEDCLDEFEPDYENTTKEFEDKNGFEYILRIDNKNIGFRYTDIELNPRKDKARKRLSECVKDYDVDEIVIVDMHFTDHVPEWDPIYFSFVEEKIGVPVRRCCLLDLFRQYSNIYAYNLYIDAVGKAIEKYKDYTSITTIPKLTAYSMYQFRFESENRFINYLTECMQCKSNNSVSNMPDNFTYGYHFLDKEVIKKKHYNCLDKRTQQLLNQTGIISRVKNKKYYRALIGRSNFAKCFLTSEYLYKYYNKKDQFDYVAIISGYLKSIEQLMFAIANTYSLSQGEYKKYDKKNKMLVTVSSPLIEDPDTTMGGLCFFYQNNKELISKLSPQQKEIFVNCLFCYKDECRNDSFHKHNITDWDRVEYIRSNTFLLYTLLLGCCDLGTNYEKNLQVATDDRISRIVYQMSDRQHYNLYWVGKKVIPVHPPDYQYFEVDEYGIMKDKAICLDVFHDNKLERSQQIVISEKALPDAIWYDDSDGNRIFLSY